MPSLSNNEVVIVVLAGLVLVAGIWLLVLTLTVRRLQKTRRKIVIALSGAVDVEEVLGRSLEDIAKLAADHETVVGEVDLNRTMLMDAIRHVGIVRYDAFAQAGGELSFSAALLNEGGDGMVLSSINGRNDSRVYAKPVIEHRSEFNLSEEEEQAIKKAFAGVKA